MRNVLADSFARDVLAEIVRINFTEQHSSRIAAEIVEIPLHPLRVVLEEKIRLLDSARKSEMRLHCFMKPGGAGALRPNRDKVRQPRCVSHARKLAARLPRSNMSRLAKRKVPLRSAPRRPAAEPERESRRQECPREAHPDFTFGRAPSQCA